MKNDENKNSEYLSIPDDSAHEFGAKCDKCGGELSFEGAMWVDGTFCKGMRGWYCSDCDGGVNEER